MLGKKITDLQGVEEGGTVRGMGLLDTETIFEAEKARTRVSGKFLELNGIFSSLSGRSFTGYEIHMGKTALLPGGRPASRMEDQVTGEKKEDGCCGENVYGTYVHGIFDKEEIATELVKALAKAKGIQEGVGTAVDFSAFKETQYDLLAQGLREHLDMERIYDILWKGIQK